MNTQWKGTIRLALMLFPVTLGLGCLSTLLGQREIERDMARTATEINRIYRLSSDTQELVNSRMKELQTKRNTDSQMMMRTLAEIESRLDSIQEDLGTVKTQLADIRYQTSREIPEQVALRIGSGDRTSTVVVEGRQLLLNARQAMVRGDFAGARAEFQQFLDQFPASKNRFEAHMGIAESFYREKKWKEAIAAFGVVVTRYPADPRAPEALMKIAICQQNMGNNKQVIATLKRLIENYPNWGQIERARDMLREASAVKPQVPPPG